MANSVRLQGLLALKEHLESFKVGSPASDPFLYDFTYVELGPLSEPDFRKRLTAGIVVGREAYNHKFPLTENDLPIVIEWYFTVNKGDARPGIMAEKVLSEIERMVEYTGVGSTDNQTLGGKVIDVLVTGNEVDLETYEDKAIVGALFLTMKYRRSIRDPRSAV